MTATKPEPLAPTSRQTGAARKALALVRCYLNDCYKTGATYPQQRSWLDSAGRYLASARALDPRMTLAVENDRGEFVTFTQDALAAEILWFEARLQRAFAGKKDALIRARDALRKAITYQPLATVYLSDLAEVYLNLFQRRRALEAARKAVWLNPQDLDAKRLLDRIETNPKLGTRDRRLDVEAAIFFGSGIAVFGIVAALVRNTFYPFVNTLIVGVAVICFGEILKRSRNLQARPHKR